MKEIWKDIKEFEGIYQVSNIGRVKRLNETCRFKYKDRIVSQHFRSKYLAVSLSKNKKQIKKSVHRLVAQAFIINPKNKHEVNHINEIKTDNVINNLEWVTHKENIIHSLALEVTQFDINGKFIEKYKSLQEATLATGIHYSNISCVCNGKRKTAGGYIWKYL